MRTSGTYPETATKSIQDLTDLTPNLVHLPPHHPLVTPPSGQPTASLMVPEAHRVWELQGSGLDEQRSLETNLTHCVLLRDVRSSFVFLRRTEDDIHLFQTASSRLGDKSAMSAVKVIVRTERRIEG